MIRQCKFRDPDEDTVYGGILCEFDNDDRYIICGDCGGIFDPDEVEIVKIYEYWVDLSSEIIGE